MPNNTQQPTHNTERPDAPITLNQYTRKECARRLHTPATTSVNAYATL